MACNNCDNCLQRFLLYKLIIAIFYFVGKLFKRICQLTKWPHPQTALIREIIRDDLGKIENILYYRKNLLLEEWRSKEQKGKRVLEYLCAEGTAFIHERHIELLLNHVEENDLQPNPHCEFKSLLHFAVSGRHEPIINAVITKFPSQLRCRDANGRTPADLARDFDDDSHVLSLLQRRETEIFNDQPSIARRLEDAVREGRLADIKAMLRKAKRDGDGVPGDDLLRLATQLSNNDVVRLLLRERCGSLATHVDALDGDVLAEHFDDCVRMPMEDTSSANQLIAFDYKTLWSTREDAILQLCNNPANKALLAHPLVRSYIEIKWHRFKLVAYRGLLFNILFWLSILLLILNEDDLDHINKPLMYTCYAFFALMFGITMLQALHAICFLNFRNLRLFGIAHVIEILFVADVIFMLFHDTDTMRIIAAFLAAFRFLIGCAIFPRVAVIIAMFVRAAQNCLRIILFFFVCIIAFAFCFNTLNGKSHEGEGFLEKKVIPLLKTVIMLKTEIGVGRFAFEGSEYSIPLHVAVMMFVFLFSIVMLNLIISVTFADIQKIKDDSQWIEISSRVRYMAYTQPGLDEVIINYYFNGVACQMFVSLWDTGRIRTKNVTDTFHRYKYCWTCLKPKCVYRLDKDIVKQAKKIAIGNLNKKAP